MPSEECPLYGYEEESLTSDETKCLKKGDKVVFIDFRDPDRRNEPGKSLHGKLLTVMDVNSGGGVKVYESPGDYYFVPRCFHRPIDRKPEVTDRDFDAVFG